MKPIPVEVCVEPGEARVLDAVEPGAADLRLVLSHRGGVLSVPAELHAGEPRFGIATIEPDPEIDYLGPGLVPGEFVRGWLVSEAAPLETCFELLPAPEFLAFVEQVAPAGDAAWLDVGARDGVRRGMRWWRRDAGQPVASLETILVERETAYCRVTLLRTPSRVQTGDRFGLWPAPADARGERVVSAVSHVEDGADDPIVWIARPPTLDPGSATRVEILDGGTYVGFATIERENDRFCFARVNSAASVRRPAVGDDVRFRTRESSLRSEFDARVFDATAEGYLITAGEPEQISTGDVGEVWRDGQRVGSVRVERLQSSYSRVVPLEAPADGIRRLDAVRFGPTDAGAAVAGFVERVYDEATALLWLPGGESRPGDVLSILSAGRVAALAVILDVEDPHALAWLPERMRIGPPDEGAVVVRTSR